MASFICFLCFNNRSFPSFGQYFRHIGRFHRNEPSFQLTCNINPNCCTVYRTYAAYKSHIYRHHAELLQQPSSVAEDFFSHELDQIDKQEPVDLDGYVYEEATDQENPSSSDPPYVFDDDKHEPSLTDIQRTYIRFLIQLREEFLLPKKIISIISSNIVHLLEGLHAFVQQHSAPPPSSQFTTMTDFQSEERVIKSNILSTAIRNISDVIESTTNSEHEFIRLCKHFMNYQTPDEILLSNPGDKAKYGYIIPIAQTLSSLFHHPQILPLVIQNIEHQQRTVKDDDDLMFSLREGNFGTRIDDKSLLIQLYIDDIGLTNPIGPRKDLHKMTMIYFSFGRPSGPISISSSKY